MWQQLFCLLVFNIPLGLGLADTESSGCGRKEKTNIILDVAKDFISRARDLHPPCTDDEIEENTSYCERRDKSFTCLEVATNLISEAKKGYPISQSVDVLTLDAGVFALDRIRRNGIFTDRRHSSGPVSECPKCQEKHMDCSEVLKSGKNESGVYTIWPRSRISSTKPLTVYCDMDTDGGGWTVIQRRGSFSNPSDYFYRDWEYYKVGFGNVKKEFWIGNDNIFAISNLAHTTIRFDLKDVDGNTSYAHYRTFWIDDETSNYTLHIKSYSGTAGDAMDIYNNVAFSTKDRDNDAYTVGSCPQDRKGAWWYDACTYSNLNGLNQPGIDSKTGMTWIQWQRTIGLAAVEIKLRPL